MKRPRPQRPASRSIWRHRASGDDALIAEMKNLLRQGAVVSLHWYGGLSVKIVRNERRYLVLRSDGFPLATVDSVVEAIVAADAHVAERFAADDEDDDGCGGAA